MQKYFGVIAVFLFIGIVLFRSLALKKEGISSIEFGHKDKKDFIILPFVLFYLYLIVAHAFGWPAIRGQQLFHSEPVSWLGVAFCGLSIIFFVWAMVSFKKSFRVGLRENKEQGLVTQGAFGISRNPIYVSFAGMLAGQFLIFPSWILLLYVFIGLAAFHRQVLKEEAFLYEQYDVLFHEYCKKVRRYL